MAESYEQYSLPDKLRPRARKLDPVARDLFLEAADELERLHGLLYGKGGALYGHDLQAARAERAESKLARIVMRLADWPRHPDRPVDREMLDDIITIIEDDK